MSTLKALLTHCAPRPWSISCVRTRIQGMEAFRIMDANQEIEIGIIWLGSPKDQYETFANSELLVKAVNMMKDEE